MLTFLVIANHISAVSNILVFWFNVHGVPRVEAPV